MNAAGAILNCFNVLCPTFRLVWHEVWKNRQNSRRPVQDSMWVLHENKSPAFVTL